MLVLTVTSSTALADAPGASKEGLHWDGFARVGAGEYFVTTFMLASLGMAQTIQPSPAPWRGRNGFDETWRTALRARSADGRRAADIASTALVALSGVEVAADALVVAPVRGDGVAWQLAMIDVQAMAFTLLLQSVVSRGASRERPYGRTCSTPMDEGDSDCTGDLRYQSFFSGHTATAFTFAGLTCMHHLRLPLYGGGGPDATACTIASVAAVTTGVLRTVADKHYLSDVLVGAGVGMLSGLGIPWLYYRVGLVRPRSQERPSGLFVTVVPSPNGGVVVGRF